MPKIGIEVEGRLRGVKTLFVDARDVLLDGKGGKLRAMMVEHCVNHVYVSDHANSLTYEAVGAAFEGHQVTIEITRVHGYGNMNRPRNVGLMLTLPQEYYNSVANLWEDDQVKFHSIDREVLCVAARNFVATTPDEFEGDTEL